MRKFKVLSIFIAVIMLAGLAFAETPSTLKRNVWNAKQTFKHGVEITGTGDITASNIADGTRGFDIHLGTLYISGKGLIGPDVDAGIASPTSPGIGVLDAIPKVIWASGELTSASFTFTVPPDYSSGLSFRILANSSTASNYASWGLDWSMFINTFGEVFASTAYDHAATVATEGSPDVKNALFTLTPTTTGAAALAAGKVVTVNLWPYDVRQTGAGYGSTEIISIQARYVAPQ